MDLKKEININKKVIIFLILLNVISISTYYSYALFQVNVIKHNAIILKTATSLDITTTIDNTTSDTFTLSGNSNKTVEVKLDTNGITSALAYKMYYEITSGTSSFTVTSTENFTDNKVEGIMQPYDRGNDTKITGKVFSLTFTNKTNNNLTIKLGATGGYEAKGATLNGQLELLINTNLPLSLSEVVKKRLGNDGLIAVNNDGELYDGTGNIREYRYSGGESEVKNYIWFNNENWRIVGVFDGKIKIVKNDPISNIPETYINKNRDLEYTLQRAVENWQELQVSMVNWNEGGTKTDMNDWSQSGLMYYLNEENSINNNSYYDLINTNYKSSIDETIYYLGNVKHDSVTPNESYTQERNIESSNIWSGNASIWNGKIALLYPSDWGYATESSAWNKSTLYMANYSQIDDIKTKNWILKSNSTTGYYWLISPVYNSSHGVALWGHYGTIGGDRVITNHNRAVRPTLYLKQNAIIYSGDGTSIHPYKIINE